MAPPIDAVDLSRPDPTDGPALLDLARRAGGLDVNSGYAYALLAREFGDTSVIARIGHEPVAFATGFRRPSAPGTLFVWQMAVHPRHRGSRLALRMLHHLVGRPPGPSAIEATVEPGNAGSLATFARLATDLGGAMGTDALLDERHLGPGHAPEHLVHIELPDPDPAPSRREGRPRPRGLERAASSGAR
jgi:L-2,4-diaminobutyric acid acetyltransferase